MNVLFFTHILMISRSLNYYLFWWRDLAGNWLPGRCETENSRGWRLYCVGGDRRCQVKRNRELDAKWVLCFPAGLKKRQVSCASFQQAPSGTVSLDGQIGSKNGWQVMDTESSVLISYSRCNRLQTGEFNTAEMYFHVALEARSPASISLGWNQSVSRVTLPLEAERDNWFLKLLAFAGFQHPFAGGHVTLICLYLHITFFSVCVLSLCFSLVSMLVIWFRVH